MKIGILGFIMCYSLGALAQNFNEYEVSFENAVHHEANIKTRFTDLSEGVLEIRMSRSSPGRYAIHEFAKNVYSVKATDGNGKALEISRPNPYQWDVVGHNGEVNFEYTLFANRAGGTYSGIDESHAHLNIPATFVFVKELEDRPVRVKFNLIPDSGWKVATQLKSLGDDTFFAPNTYYFMDSPIEVANYYLREEKLDGQNIRWIVHKPDISEEELDKYFSAVMEIVRQQKAVYGELPKFDFNEYTFLTCYMPNASGDGMEHRNSTYVVGTFPVEQSLGLSRIGTISHEFFHAWNVERIRPKSLEPFNFEKANMSGELWFAEGFTSYYTQLILTRAGINSPKEFFRSSAGSVANVMNSPGTNYFNPIEMSYQAPFVDAATSVDPVNRSNTFISYYTYGHVLGLALDMSLRSLSTELNLDDYMKLVWVKHGKEELTYEIDDLRDILSEYASKEFAKSFFSQHIYDSKLPDYQDLFRKVGVDFRNKSAEQPHLGNYLTSTSEGWKIVGNAKVGGPLYVAGVEREDVLLKIADVILKPNSDIKAILSSFKPGDTIDIEFEKIWGLQKRASLKLTSRFDYIATIDPDATASQVKLREAWLKGR